MCSVGSSGLVHSQRVVRDISGSENWCRSYIEGTLVSWNHSMEGVLSGCCNCGPVRQAAVYCYNSRTKHVRMAQLLLITGAVQVKRRVKPHISFPKRRNFAPLASPWLHSLHSSGEVPQKSSELRLLVSSASISTASFRETLHLHILQASRKRMSR